MLRYQSTTASFQLTEAQLSTRGIQSFWEVVYHCCLRLRYRRETEQVLIRVLIHPYSRGDEVPCTLFTYYRGGREESYNQIKTY